MRRWYEPHECKFTVELTEDGWEIRTDAYSHLRVAKVKSFEHIHYLFDNMFDEIDAEIAKGSK